MTHMHPENETPANSGPVTLINSFAVPPGRDKAFLKLWRQTSAHFRGQPGFLSLRLHKAVSDDASYRFVNVAQWQSIDEFSNAHRAKVFLDLIANPAWAEFESKPALYQVEVEMSGGEVWPSQDKPAGCL